MDNTTNNDSYEKFRRKISTELVNEIEKELYCVLHREIYIKLYTKLYSGFFNLLNLPIKNEKNIYRRIT